MEAKHGHSWFVIIDIVVRLYISFRFQFCSKLLHHYIISYIFLKFVRIREGRLLVSFIHFNYVSSHFVMANVWYSFEFWSNNFIRMLYCNLILAKINRSRKVYTNLNMKHALTAHCWMQRTMSCTPVCHIKMVNR